MKSKDARMGRLRVGVVGVGHLGKEHARILAGFPEVELIGVADANPDQAQSVARKCNCPWYASHRPLLHLAEAAVIAVPTVLHRPIAGEFLHCGIPVLIEKPMACSLQEADELLELARRHEVGIQVGHIERFNPAVERLHHCTLQPKFIQAERLSSFSGRSTDIGVVLDLMIHDLDIVLNLVKAPVRSVDALGVSIFGGHEDVANVRLTFEDGCVANLTASRASRSGTRHMQLWGPEGYAGVDFARRCLTLIQPSAQVRRSGLDIRKLDPASRAMLKDQLFGRHLEVLDLECNDGSDALTRELQDFVRSVQTGTLPRVTGRMGREAIALAARILDKIKQHSWQGDASGPAGPFNLPEPLGLLFPAYRDRVAAA